MASVIVFLTFLLLFLLRVPVTTAIGVGCVAALLASGRSLQEIPRHMMGGIESFILLAIPFFVLAGNLFNVGGATTRLFSFCEVVFGRIPGGLAQVSIAANVVFSGMSGAAIADLAGLGTITVKAMRQAGYRERFAAAVALAASVLGPIIPPSIMFVIYAASTNTSIGRLFLAGVGAGLAIAAILMLYIAVIVLAKWEPCPAPRRYTAGEAVRETWAALPALAAPVVILGAMRVGAVTATEAGVLAVVYAAALGLLYRGFTLRNVSTALVSSTVMSASILYLIAVSGVMGHILTADRVAHAVSEAMTGITTDRVLGMLLINVVLLVIGCVLETTPALLITAPILTPVAAAYGVDPVHFGVILCLNLIIGIVHPPMGIGLFVMSSVTRVSMEAITRATIPFLLPLLVSLLVITYVPALSLWLPDLVFGKAK
ncbi:MAG: TRAP transporter large permease [Betaproteobacteria bacterium]